jgi:hypothetical protein
VEPTVLPFGQKNSGTEAQGPHRVASQNLRNMSNYVGDWLSCANTLEELYEQLEAFLEMCVKYDITLNCGKTKFGYGKANFFGFTVSYQGTTLADKHLNPLETIPPK